jgi:tetratricopeptide (TPR) repeat protein
MIMKKNIALLAAIFCTAGLTAQIMVLPLKVDTQNHASYQWLGKAFAYYLLSGLSLNGLPVIDHEESQQALNRNLVRFPFDITKATAIFLARENQADRLLWGEILYSDKSSTQIAIKVFLIDVKGQVQKHLPMLKGNLRNIYQMQEELLKEIIKVLAPQKTTILFPELNLALPDYEKFIKNLLVVDTAKKLELLQSIKETDNLSGFLNFELAKIHLDKNDLASSEAYLKRIKADSLFRDKKEFLSALINFAYGYSDLALNQFIRLQQQNIYAVATNNNLGVIYMQKGDYPTAEKCLQYALYLKKDPEIFSNMVILLHLMGQNGRAAEELNRALQLFPNDDKLLKQFSVFMAASKNRELLAQAFRNLLPPLPQGEESLSTQPLLKNPFQMKPWPGIPDDSNAFHIEARSLFLENDFSGAMQKAEEAMEVNPFLNENHHLLAMLYLQKQNYPQAEIYAQSALFLKENPDNFLLLIKIYQAWKDKEKFRETLARALQKFPQSAELLELKGHGN